MNPALVRELFRKAFHMLSLLYLGAYLFIGWPGLRTPMLVWAAAVTAVETARLASPALNAWLTARFRGLARAEESDKYSGIIHTTFGVLAIFWLFGAERPDIVKASILCVAFGDAAAALVGKAIGRHKLAASKSLEGTLACLLVCLAACRLCGFGWIPSVCAAAVATVVEFLPATRWFNDNLWMPLLTAVALKLCAA